MPDSLTITREWFALLDSLPDDSFRRVMRAVASLAFDGTKPEGMSDTEKRIFVIMKTAIQTRKRVARYYNKNKKNRKNLTLESYASESELKRMNQTLESYALTEQELPLNIKENQENNLKDITLDFKEDREKINQKENEENKPTARRVFKVPTLEEVRDYIRSKGYSVDPEEFFSFYESQGWHVGKNKMRDWHRAVSYWQCRINNRNKTRSQLRDYSGI